MKIVHKTGIPGRVIAEILNGVKHRSIITSGEESGPRYNRMQDTQIPVMGIFGLALVPIDFTGRMSGSGRGHQVRPIITPGGTTGQMAGERRTRVASVNSWEEP
jgi:hypothetical protein